MKRNMKRVVSFLVFTCLLTGLLSGCAAVDERQCKQIVREFEIACRSGDLDSILNCTDKNSARVIRGITGIASNLFAVEDEAILNRVSEALFGIDFVAEFMKTIQFEIEKLEIKDEEATATGAVNYQNLLGSHVSREVSITFTKEEGMWLIHKLKFI